MDYEKRQNLGGEAANWEVTPDRDPRALGNKIISTPELSTDDRTLELGRVVSTEPILITPTLPPKSPEEPAPTIPFDYRAVREEKGSGRISTHTLTEITKLEQKLAEDGNLSDFYENARSMTGAYLDNSFNRKLGESK